MSRAESFDFRTLLATANQAAAPAGPDPCIVGVAWTDEGIGMVALALSETMSKKVKAYANLAFGPFKDDWPRIAPLVQHCPLIFHDKLPLVFLCDFSKEAGRKYPIERAFLSAFGARAQVLTRDEVETWASIVMPSITPPDIPARDSWTIKPIRAAAETMLYAGNQVALSYAARPVGDGSARHDA